MKYVSLFLITLCCFTFSACGGTIKTAKIDLAKLSPANRAKVKEKQDAVDKAKADAAKARAEADAADEQVDKAKATVKEKKADLEIAEKKLDLEKAKSSAGREEDSGAAKDEVKAAEKALDVAEAALKAEKAKQKHLAALASEAEAALKVAKADLEHTKVGVSGGSGPEHDQLAASFEKQYREAQADHAEAKKKTAKALEERQEAEKDLASTQS